MKLFYICCTMRMVTSNMIKSLRKSRNLTQEQLGILSGMSKSQISKMEMVLWAVKKQFCVCSMLWGMNWN